MMKVFMICKKCKKEQPYRGSWDERIHLEDQVCDSCGEVGDFEKKVWPRFDKDGKPNPR